MFSEKTGLIEGIVVRGETDYRHSDSGDCNVVNRKPEDGGRGEDVIKISRILPSLDAAAKAPLDLGAAADALDPKIRTIGSALDGLR